MLEAGHDETGDEGGDEERAEEDVDPGGAHGASDFTVQGPGVGPGLRVGAAGPGDGPAAPGRGGAPRGGGQRVTPRAEPTIPKRSVLSMLPSSAEEPAP
ncbi:hypothetical protein GCM10027596_05070 [Nocardioides korecus]